MAKLKIDVHNLHKQYGKNKVLKGISAKFYEGDVVFDHRIDFQDWHWPCQQAQLFQGVPYPIFQLQPWSLTYVLQEQK